MERLALRKESTMGHAWRAPDASYVRQYQVAGHAVLRLRQRIQQLANATYRSDDDLANGIDAAVNSAVAHGLVEKILDDGEETKLVDLTRTFDDLFALVKQNKRPGPKEVILTLLTTSMVEVSRRTSRWTKPTLGTLADVVDIKMLASQVKPMKAPSPTVELRMVSYRTTDGKTHHEMYEKTHVAAEISQLCATQDVVTDSIELWKRVSFKPRMVVDMEE
jgi:hypothetical protein